MKLCAGRIFSLSRFSAFLIVVAFFTWSCGGGPTSTQVASILVTNKSSYPATMEMDGGTAVAISASGGSHTFTTGIVGTHSFSATSSAAQTVIGTTTCPGNVASCTSYSSFVLNQQYVININNTGGLLFCSPTNFPYINWVCP
jgi:hypothetical protein